MDNNLYELHFLESIPPHLSFRIQEQKMSCGFHILDGSKESTC